MKIKMSHLTFFNVSRPRRVKPVLWTTLSKFSFAMVVIVEFLVCCHSTNCSLRSTPEFAEPIKNVTLAVGSNVEFSCDVRHLGTFRVAWIWSRGEDQRFLTIGVVKITNNQRVKLTRLQKSDDVTQFNLYVNHIKKEDMGNYHCSVNSNPMIAQVGTLDVIGDGVEEENKDPPPENGERPEIPFIPLGIELLSPASVKFPDEDESAGYGEETRPDVSVDDDPCLNDRDSVSCRGDKSGSKGEDFRRDDARWDKQTKNASQGKTSCNEFQDAWENVKVYLAAFFATVAKYSYSYWFS